MGLLEQRAAYSILLSGKAKARSSSSCSSVKSCCVLRNTLGFVFCLLGHKSIILWVNSLRLPPHSRKIPSLSQSFLFLCGVSVPADVSGFRPTQRGAPQPSQTMNQTEKQSIACCWILIKSTAIHLCTSCCTPLRWQFYMHYG